MSSRITASYCPTYDADTTLCPVSNRARPLIVTKLRLLFAPLWNLARFSTYPRGILPSFLPLLHLLSTLFLTVVPAFLAIPRTASDRCISLRNSAAFWTSCLHHGTRCSALVPLPTSLSARAFSCLFARLRAAFFSLYFTLFLVWLLVPFQQISSSVCSCSWSSC